MTTDEAIAQMKAYVKPKVGDKINTPMGVEVVTHADEFRFSSQHYGNVPFFEGGNWRVFTVAK